MHGEKDNIMANKIYSKQDAVMIRGLAILCMVVLHLFCRTGKDVFGRPLLWINSTIPVVFLFGFFSEICVPLYSLCAGYARQYMEEKKKSSWKNNFHRIMKLMVNYWIVLVLFSILGLIFDVDNKIPGSLIKFLKSIVLLHSYNGAWWYLNTYILLLLIPTKILLNPIKKVEYKKGLIMCLLFEIGWYVVTKIELIPDIPEKMKVVLFIKNELVNLITVLPFVWAGAIICKEKLVDNCNRWLKTHVKLRWQNKCLIIVWIGIFCLFNLLHKAVLIGIVAFCSFMIFNLIKKPEIVKKIFLFLGKHSTNIWLTHMFFYLVLFKGLVIRAQYPILMLGFMLILCIATSYIIMGIEHLIYNFIEYIMCYRERLQREKR